MKTELLENLHHGLNLMMQEGVIEFDRPTPVRRLATATLRGLTGQALLQYRPELVQRWFKPDPDGNRAPAYAFQPLHSEAGLLTEFPFRVMTWDPDGELAEGIAQALQDAAGMPFGQSGALVTNVTVPSPRKMPFHKNAFETARIVLHSSLRVRHGNAMVREDQLVAGHLVEAAVSRINKLSIEYGNGLQLDALSFLAASVFIKETRRNLRWVAPRRYSSTQDQTINLSGIVGHLEITAIPSLISNLLSAASVINIGRSTTNGCGYISLHS